MQYFTANLSLLVTSLKKITNFIIKDFNELNYLTLSSQSNSAFSNNTFKFVEKKIIEDITKIKPDYSFILSNGNIIENKDKSNYIVVSNINGFNNFKKSIPYFTISIALIRDNQEFAAAIYQPLIDNLYIAEKNKGAYVNKLRLKSRYNNNISKNNFLIATDNPATLNNRFDSSLYWVTQCPTLDICFLSSLKVDLCYYNNILNYFEILPALIIAQEAGFSITYKRKNNNIHNLIIGNSLIRENLNI